MPRLASSLLVSLSGERHSLPLTGTIVGTADVRATVTRSGEPQGNGRLRAPRHRVAGTEPAGRPDT